MSHLHITLQNPQIERVSRILIRKFYQVLFIDRIDGAAQLYTCIVWGAEGTLDGKTGRLPLTDKEALQLKFGGCSVDKAEAADFDFFSKSYSEKGPWQKMWGKTCVVGRAVNHNDLDQALKGVLPGHVNHGNAEPFTKSLKDLNSQAFVNWLQSKNLNAIILQDEEASGRALLDNFSICIPSKGQLSEDNARSEVTYEVSGIDTNGFSSVDVLSWTAIPLKFYAVSDLRDAEFAVRWTFDIGKSNKRDNHWKFDDLKVYVVAPRGMEIDVDSATWQAEPIAKGKRKNAIAKVPTDREAYFEEWISEKKILNREVYRVSAKGIYDIYNTIFNSVTINFKLRYPPFSHFTTVVALLLSAMIGLGFDATRLGYTARVLKSCDASWCLEYPFGGWVSTTLQWLIFCLYFAIFVIVEFFGKWGGRRNISGSQIVVNLNNISILAVGISALYFISTSVFLADIFGFGIDRVFEPKILTISEPMRSVFVTSITASFFVFCFSVFFRSLYYLSSKAEGAYHLFGARKYVDINGVFLIFLIYLMAILFIFAFAFYQWTSFIKPFISGCFLALFGYIVLLIWTWAFYFTTRRGT